MITSAHSAASSSDFTVSPAFSALLFDDEPVAEPDTHVDAGFLEVQGMRMALRAVADDGDLAAADDGGVGIGFVVDVGGHVSAPFLS